MSKPDVVAKFVAFLLITLLTEVVSVFVSLGYLKNGATDRITIIYGLVNGLSIVSATVLSFTFLAKQHVAKQEGWKLGSLVFLTCLMVSVALAVLAMQDALAYNTFNWPTSFLILGLEVVGLLSLRFFGKIRFVVPFAEDELGDSDIKLNDL